MNTWADEYIQLLDDCEAREDRLTDWERGFVDSMQRQLAEGDAQRNRGNTGCRQQDGADEQDKRMGAG